MPPGVRQIHQLGYEQVDEVKNAYRQEISKCRMTEWQSQ